MKKRGKIVILPSIGTPPVGDLADLVVDKLATTKRVNLGTPKPPNAASGRVHRR